MGLWFCFNPWAPQMPSPVQQQGSGAWRPGILGAAPQAHTAFAPLQVSPPAPMWDQAGLVAALNQTALQNQSTWIMDSGPHPT